MTHCRIPHGGSREPRLSPEFRSGRSSKGPAIRATSFNNPVREQDANYRRSLIGLPSRFIKD